MKLKKLICLCIYFFLFSHPVYSESLADRTVESVSLLTFHMQQWLEELTVPTSENTDRILLSKEERQAFWDRTAKLIYLNEDKNQQQLERLFSAAYIAYEDSLYDQEEVSLEKAIEDLAKVCQLLQNLRDQLLDVDADEESNILASLLLMSTPLSELQSNHAIPSSAKKKMRPYIIPANHPMRERLDALFKPARITANENVFHAAGFTTICQRPRTFVRVARHPLLEGHLIKVYMDTELRKKQGKESWEWFVKRCEGAKKVREVIKKRNIKHFVVADKYIYPLPQNPSPPHDRYHTRHLAVLLVTDMNLAPDSVNYRYWERSVTKEQLNELYDIITYARGSSYRPDNICYTNNGQFAFIDTEYPSRGPDYNSIRHFLSSSRRAYWDELVKKGK